MLSIGLLNQGSSDRISLEVTFQTLVKSLHEKIANIINSKRCTRDFHELCDYKNANIANFLLAGPIKINLIFKT